MNIALRTILIVVLAFASQGLAGARGQSTVAGATAICLGDTVVTITVDKNGKPVQQSHICPDMALSLMSGLTVAPFLPERTTTSHTLNPVVISDRDAGRAAPVARARAPPVALA